MYKLLSVGMNPKKCHEVFYGAEIIGKIASQKGCTVVIDIGSGIGYLSSTLALKHNLNVIGLERKQDLNISAEERMNTLKNWNEP